MSNQPPINLPKVTDDDIRWVSALLGLKANAFYGVNGKDPRQKALKLMETIDIAACPGSGKTTLLVAKLAILAQKWTYHTQGLCVLSHTNAARYEIETKLGNTSVGRSLLSYPHYIGTIHGFVNKFLSLPLLRSYGLANIHFSNEISGAKLWRLCGNGAKIKEYLDNNFKTSQDRQIAIKSIHYVGENLDICLKTSKRSIYLKRESDSPTFRKVNGWKKDVLQDGFAAYDDIIAYGQFVLKTHPWVTKIIRGRFPIIFIDEAQDNNEEQSTLLDRIFMADNSHVVCQRFGDANQAIFGSINDKGVKTKAYIFPATNIDVIGLPNSNRFGQQIASLADPLGLRRYAKGLIGQGPKPKRPEFHADPTKCKHTIFLFNDGSANRVLDAYGELLLKTFPKDLAHPEFKAVAVGQVHRPPNEEPEKKFPRHVKDYWDAYSPEITRPSTFIHHVLAGQEKAEANKMKMTHPVVEEIAEGILRLARMGKTQKGISLHQHHHRNIRELLKKSDKLHDYEEIVFRVAVKRETPTRKVWERDWREKVRKIAEAIANVKLSDQDVEGFLSWPLESDVNGYEAYQAPSFSQCNIYPYPANEHKVHIRVGSIHSVKGQTHTATLVLETFWHDSNLESLLPWLCCEESGCTSKTRIRQRTRLKLHYVAMTRPTHLLCLAMKRSSVSDEYREKLRKRGWDVVEVK